MVRTARSAPSGPPHVFVAVAPNVVATSQMALSLFSTPEAPDSPAHAVPSGPERCRVIPFDPLREAAGAAVGAVVSAVASPHWDLALLRVSARFPSFASPFGGLPSPIDTVHQVTAVATQGSPPAVEPALVARGAMGGVSSAP
jgi:hypothetical protein